MALSFFALFGWVGLLGFRQLYAAQKKIIHLNNLEITRLKAKNQAIKEMIGVVRVTVPNYEEKVKK